MTIEINGTSPSSLSAVQNALGMLARRSSVARNYTTPGRALPAVSLDATPLSGGVTKPSYNRSLAIKDPAFAYYGAAAANVAQAGTTSPTYDYVNAARAVADTNGGGRLITSFYHTGVALDVLQYGLSQTVELYVDDVFVGVYGSPWATGTAQSGGASTIALAAGSSAVDNFYRDYYIRITGGTGVLNEVRRVTGYVGSTKVATVASAWTTPPDATTTYAIQDNDAPFAMDALTGSIKYLHLVWPSRGTSKITIIQAIFSGVRMGPYDSIGPAPPMGDIPMLIVGDSIPNGTAAPVATPLFANQLARAIGAVPYNLSSGGTGWGTPATGSGSSNRLNFEDRICPPNEAWKVLNQGTAGTYTISVTFGGSTQTTTALAFGASRTTIENALNALSNVSGVGNFAVARGDFNTPNIILGRNLPGATISFDTTSLTGTITNQGQWLGDVASNLPKDAAGNALPFILLVVGSGNDSSLSDATITAISNRIAAQILLRFPTAIPIFTGLLGDCNPGDGGAISAANISRNVAFAAGAASLPKLNGVAPFIDTYEAGLAGDKIITGTGSVAAPTSGKNDTLKSATTPGHPTGDGGTFLVGWLGRRVQTLLTGV